MHVINSDLVPDVHRALSLLSKEAHGLHPAVSVVSALRFESCGLQVCSPPSPSKHAPTHTHTPEVASLVELSQCVQELWVVVQHVTHVLLPLYSCVSDPVT